MNDGNIPNFTPEELTSSVVSETFTPSLISPSKRMLRKQVLLKGLLPITLTLVFVSLFFAWRVNQLIDNRSEFLDEAAPTNQVDLSSIDLGTPLNSADMLIVNGAMISNGTITAKEGVILSPQDPPLNPQDGYIYFDKETDTVRYYNGTAFKGLLTSDDQINQAGADGAPGATGPQGLNGINGTDGINGLNGTNGADGIDGTDGTDGIDGVDGAPGATGPQGPAGPSGTATCPNGLCLSLQTTAPGAVETGNINISGDIFTGGNIGIGTTSPSARLEVTGGSGTTVGTIINNGTSTGNILNLQDNGTDVLTVADGGDVNFGGNLTVVAGRSVTLTGGNTATRPSPPAEGMIYFDTDTDTLLTYSNGKWQADRTDAIIVAASNSSQKDKDSADYVADGNTGAALDGDQVQINAALTAGSGKKIVLLAGTYVIDDTIYVPNDTVLSGVGYGSVVELADMDSFVMAIRNLDELTPVGITIRDFKLDGRDDLNTSGSQFGIWLDDGIGGGARSGATISNMLVEDFRNTGITVAWAEEFLIEGNQVRSNDIGINANGPNPGNAITNNILTENTTYGIQAMNGNIVVSDNVISSTAGRCIYLISADDSVVSGNVIFGCATGIYSDADGFSPGLVIEGNSIRDASAYGIYISTGDDVSVRNNSIRNSGGATANNAIVIFDDAFDTTNNNSITSNTISDSGCSITCYAVSILSGTTNTYLADNTYSGTSTNPATINDLGTGTVYASQLTPSQILQSGSSLIRASTTSVITGSIDPTASTSVTGVGTLFTTQLQVGDRITVNGESRTVTVITNNTSLTVDTAFTDTVNDTTIDRLPASLKVTNSAGVTQLLVQDNGNVGIGTTSPSARLEVTGGSGTTVGAIINNGTSTGNILNLQDNGTDVLTVADGGAIIAKNTSNSTAAFQVQNTSGTSLLSVNTTNSVISLNGDTALGGTSLVVATAQPPIRYGSIVNATIESIGVIGRDTDVAVGLDTFSRVVYYDQTNGDLRYIQCTNADCSTRNASALDTTGSVGITPDIEIGSDGFARIAYYDTTNDDLKFILCASADCSSNTTSIIDATGNVGGYPSLVLASDGFARISYSDDTNDDLKYMICTNSDCTVNTTNAIDSTGTVGGESHLAIASDGYPRILYQEYAASGKLKYMQCFDVSCTSNTNSEITSTGNLGYNSAMALGGDDFARISYLDQSTYDVGYILCTNADCTARSSILLDTAGTTGYGNAMVLGVDGYARISYANDLETTSDLTLIQCTNDACSNTFSYTVDTRGVTGEYSSITLGSDGYLRIAYHEENEREVKLTTIGSSSIAVGTNDVYAADGVTAGGDLSVNGAASIGDSLKVGNRLQVGSYVGSSLTSLSVAGREKILSDLDTVGNIGEHSAITIGNDGFPRIAYSDNTNTQLKYMRCTNDLCSTSTTQALDAAALDVNETSITIGSDGFARIAYVGIPVNNDDMKFVQCTNEDCSTNNITTLVSSGTVGSGNSIQMAPDGYARISFYSVFGSTLRYAQCTNDACTTSSIQTIDSVTSSSTSKTSLRIGGDGFGRIVYHDSTNNDLKFIQCTNANCSTRTTTTIDSTGNVGKYSSLTLASDGNALISYFDETNADLKYIRCLDASCSTRSTQTLDSSGSVGYLTTIALGTDGLPRISYYNNTNKQYLLIRCGNLSCTSISSQVIDTAYEYTFFSNRSSLIVGSDGYERFTYYDYVDGDLKFARFGSPTALSYNGLEQNDAYIAGVLGVGGATFFGNDVTVAGTLALGGGEIQSEGLQLNSSLGTSLLRVDAEGATFFRNTTNSTSAFRVQTSSSVDVLRVDTTNSVVVVTALRSGTITVNGKIITGNTSGTTTIAAGANAGTGATASLAGNDTSGTVTITTGTGSTAGTLATVTFASGYGTAPRVTLTAANADTSNLNLYYNSTTASLTIEISNAPVDATQYIITFLAVQ